MLSSVVASDPAHDANALSVEALKQPHVLSSYNPTFRSVQKALGDVVRTSTSESLETGRSPAAGSTFREAVPLRRPMRCHRLSAPHGPRRRVTPGLLSNRRARASNHRVAARLYAFPCPHGLHSSRYHGYCRRAAHFWRVVPFRFSRAPWFRFREHDSEGFEPVTL